MAKQVELSIKNPSWGRLTRRIGKPVREPSGSTRDGLFVLLIMGLNYQVIIASMKKIIVIAIFAVILIPNLASARWYNPLDWFQKTENQNPSLEQKINDLEVKINSQENTEVKIEPKPEIQEIPTQKEKIQTQIIEVDNSELQLKINLLQKENSDLKTQISVQTSVMSQLNLCRADLEQLKQTTPRETTEQPKSNSQCKNAKIAYQTAVKATTDLETWRQKEQAKYRNICGSACVSADIEREFGLKIQPLNNNVTKTNADMRVYCE